MAAPTSPVTRHSNPPLTGSSFYGPEPQTGRDRSPRPNGFKDTRVRTLSSSKDHAIQLDQLRGRNQWLQYAVAGFAAWSVASTYMVVSYQGEERQALEGKIAMLKSGLFDYQSTAEDVLEVAYRNVEGPRSFAEISASLALSDVAPIETTAKPYGSEGQLDQTAEQQAADLSSEALQAHPHPEALAEEAADAAPLPAQALAEVGPRSGVAAAAPATLKLSPYRSIFGLAPQYSLLAEPSYAPKASFSQVEDRADQLSLSSRLPGDSLSGKLMPVSVAKLSLSGQKSGKMSGRLGLKSYRRAPKRAVQAKRAMIARSSRKAQVGNIQINAYPGRSGAGRGIAAPFSRGGQAPTGDVAKLVLP